LGPKQQPSHSSLQQGAVVPAAAAAMHPRDIHNVPRASASAARTSLTRARPGHLARQPSDRRSPTGSRGRSASRALPRLPRQRAFRTARLLTWAHRCHTERLRAASCGQEVNGRGYREDLADCKKTGAALAKASWQRSERWTKTALTHRSNPNNAPRARIRPGRLGISSNRTGLRSRAPRWSRWTRAALSPTAARARGTNPS
jgi:hypothetical protein